jgi:hypothetical protein
MHRRRCKNRASHPEVNWSPGGKLPAGQQGAKHRPEETHVKKTGSGLVTPILTSADDNRTGERNENVSICREGE